jgi:hypothetical protein
VRRGGQAAELAEPWHDGVELVHARPRVAEEFARARGVAPRVLDGLDELRRGVDTVGEIGLELMMSLSARVLARRAAVSALAPTMAKLGNTTRPSGARCVVGASGAAAGWRRVKVPGSADWGFLPCYPSLFRARPRYARWPRPT